MFSASGTILSQKQYSGKLEKSKKISEKNGESGKKANIINRRVFCIVSSRNETGSDYRRKVNV